MAHTKRTRDVSVMCRRMTHSWESERGHQGYPPGGGETSREISGRGRAPLLSGATLSEHVTKLQWWMEQLLYTSTKLQHLQCLFQSRTHTHTQDHTHKRVLTHIYTHTHLPACRQSHFISINTFVLLLHLTQNRHTHCCPAYKCRKCAVNITKLGICKFH